MTCFITSFPFCTPSLRLHSACYQTCNLSAPLKVFISSFNIAVRASFLNLIISMNSYRDESKRFQVRDSPLTKALRISSAARGTYSALLALTCLLLIRIVASYILDPTARSADWELLQRSSRDFQHFLYGWLMLHLIFTLIGCSAAKVRVTTNLTPIIYYPIAFVYIASSFVFVVFHSMKTEMHVSMSLALGMEHIRMVMKMISFVVENERKMSGLEWDSDCNGMKAEPPTFRSFLYFMFAPTLIYRDKYPQSEGPFNYRSLITWTIQCLCNTWIALHLAAQIGIPSAKYVGLEPVTGSKLIDLLSRAFVGGLFVYLITVGYGYLHCFSNAFAEILRFGDRRFYGNWWSAPNMFVYFGKWNFVVNAWLSEYLYKPVIQFTGKRSVAVVTVFMVSGLFHDFIMSVALRFLFTIWSLTAFGLTPFFLFWMRATPRRSSSRSTRRTREQQLPLTDITCENREDRSQKLEPLNIFPFFMFFAFLSFFSFCNAVEYFAHENCPPYGDEWYWYLIPRFPTCIQFQLFSGDMHAPVVV